ncbi:lactonase family protein [Pseudomonas eucalypticola]|uniref:Lactonase family protein n=2 Tax=Pseudomonas TaxID=286 RepID=A0A7D5H4G6_9PSED|nr:lactonase family protein [Pseudomonas eucalypticola]QKZ03769.1 lactonase family protein [Pseudomonas eucalypticola]
MKRHLLPLLLASGITVLSSHAMAASGYDLLVGTYTNNTSEGIYRYHFDSATGQIGAKPLQVTKVENPSWLTISKDQKHLFAVNENGPDSTHDKVGKVSAFKIDPKSHDLTLINQVEAKGEDPTFSSLAKGEKHLFVANYEVHPNPNGSLSVFGVGADGTLSELVQQESHDAASKVVADRQASDHVHSVVSSPDGRFVYVQDLGADKVFVYHYDAANTAKPLTAASPASIDLPPGSGPRHLLFSADGKHAYLTTEMSAQVFVFDVKAGNLVQKQVVELAAGGDAKHKAAAALHFSADGKFFYVTNRGEASELLAFTVDKATGELKEVQRRSVEGVEPREFTVDPSGKFVLIANQKSNQIVVVKRDPASGKLGETVQKFDIDAPSDVKFLR